MLAEISTAQLRGQYPLSQKKFTKKMIQKSFLFVFSSFVFGFLIWLLGLFLLPSAFSFSEAETITKGLLWFSFGCYAVAFVAQWFIYAWYVKWYIKSYHYEDEADFLTIRKGVFTPAEIHVQYLKMQDVYVDQDILDRILGIYDVHISSATYTSGLAAHIDGVDKEVALGLKNLFLAKIKDAGEGRLKRQISQEQKNDSTTEQNQAVPSTAVNFSRPISDDAFGLSKSWWLSEIVKISLGSVVFPFFLSLWLFNSLLTGKGGHQVFFWIWLIMVASFYIFRFAYLWLWQMHYKYNFGPEYIYLKEGVLSVSEKNMGYNSVQDVRINQTFIDRIFGVADVIIENASANNVPQYQKKGKVVSNGIVIEGLSLTDAKQIVEEVKTVLINKVGLNKGL